MRIPFLDTQFDLGIISTWVCNYPPRFGFWVFSPDMETACFLLYFWFYIFLQLKLHSFIDKVTYCRDTLLSLSIFILIQHVAHDIVVSLKELYIFNSTFHLKVLLIFKVAMFDSWILLLTVEHVLTYQTWHIWCQGFIILLILLIVCFFKEVRTICSNNLLLYIVFPIFFTRDHHVGIYTYIYFVNYWFFYSKKEN